jgi:hypothetical protein
MKVIANIAILVLGSTLASFAQTTQEPPKSLAEIARDSRKGQKEHATIILSDDTQRQPREELIPDVFYSGLDNTDEILKAIATYRSTHNLQETENLVHVWYDKHDAMLADAIEENRRIDQRERDRQMGYQASDARPRTQQEYMEMQHVELISRREDMKHKQDNGLLSARIQQTFGHIRAQMRTKYRMNMEWFKIRCGNGNCSF